MMVMNIFQLLLLKIKKFLFLLHNLHFGIWINMKYNKQLMEHLAKQPPRQNRSGGRVALLDAAFSAIRSRGLHSGSGNTTSKWMAPLSGKFAQSTVPLSEGMLRTVSRKTAGANRCFRIPRMLFLHSRSERFLPLFHSGSGRRAKGAGNAPFLRNSGSDG